MPEITHSNCLHKFSIWRPLWWCRSLKHHHFCIPEIENPILGFFLIPLVKSFVLCNSPKRSTRWIFNSFKIGQVINSEVPSDLLLPNKVYLGHLSLPYLVYLIKHTSNCLINSAVRGLFATAKLLYLYLSFLCTLSILISIHPSYHPMLPFPNGKHINRTHGIWNVFLEAWVSIITMLSEVPLHCSPKDWWIVLQKYMGACEYRFLDCHQLW